MHQGGIVYSQEWLGQVAGTGQAEIQGARSISLGAFLNAFGVPLGCLWVPLGCLWVPLKPLGAVGVVFVAWTWRTETRGARSPSLGALLKPFRVPLGGFGMPLGAFGNVRGALGVVFVAWTGHTEIHGARSTSMCAFL